MLALPQVRAESSARYKSHCKMGGCGAVLSDQQHDTKDNHNKQ